jgi:hypothetical protein
MVAAKRAVFMIRRRLWLVAACILYLLLACYQLGLPGIHYDEAKEAGVNAVELLKGDPVTPFRNTALTLFGRQFPLMVQDYIGALNVYLALPLLALTGVGVPNLRVLPVLTGLAVLPLAAYTVSAWQTLPRGETSFRRVCEEESPLRQNSRRGFLTSVPLAARNDGLSLTWGGVMAAWLLAASPSFLFWSRQGIFVTNLMQPLCLLAIWQGTRWLASGARRNLWWAMAAAGLALYTKLLAVWVIGPWLLLLALLWLWAPRKGDAPRFDGVAAAGALLLFVLPLVPLILFNVQTGGTLQTLLSNAGQSYYGVDNLAIWRNGGVRLAQWVQSLRGDQFWYLGGLFGNPLAPWLVVAGLAAGLGAAWRRMGVAVTLLLMAVAASCFTISDLFITHYALIQPLTLVVAALGLGLAWQRWGRLRWVVALLVAIWVILDLRATLLYHQALAHSGGLADHSDATYHLAYHLRYNGLGAPIALDWGMDASVRFLSENTVRPIEIFGYESPTAPDEGFDARLDGFLGNPDNVYLLHASGQTVFAGRREAFMTAVAARGQVATLERSFSQRDGTPLYELWRVGDE